MPALGRIHGYRNINPLSIDYACRPRLRSRLTLGGLTFPGTLGHPADTFLTCFATHACILTPTPPHWITWQLPRMQDAPTHPHHYTTTCKVMPMF